MRILIADDHAMLRAGLKQVLGDDFPHAEFGDAGTTPETIEKLQQAPWDVLLLDIFMPGRGGLDVLDEVRVNYPALPVLVISSAPEEQLAIRMLQAGASGYLNKQAAPDELVIAIKKVLSGHRYVSPALAETLADQFGKPAAGLHKRLSDREFQVLQLLVSGKPLKEIATLLSLSPKTISTFRARLLDKLGLKNDVQLVHYALQQRLVERDPRIGPV